MKKLKDFPLWQSEEGTITSETLQPSEAGPNRPENTSEQDAALITGFLESNFCNQQQR